MSKDKCVSTVWDKIGNFGRWAVCCNSAKLEHNGKAYCGIHYPPNVEARRQKQSDKWRGKAEERANGYRRADLIQKVAADQSNEVLQRVLSIGIPALLAKWDGEA